MTADTIYNVVRLSYYLLQNAKIQQQAIGLGGRVTYLNELPAGWQSQREDSAGAGAGRQGGGGGGRRLGPVEGREWVYWAQTIPVD